MAIGWLGACAPSRGTFIDTTIDRPFELCSTLGPGSVGFASHPGPQPPVALHVELVRTDRPRYRTQDRIAFDLRLTNTSSAPIAIPWSPVPVIRQDGSTCLVWGPATTSIALFAVGDGPPVRLGFGSPLHGSPDVAGSMKRIAPGSSVLIRSAVSTNLARAWDSAAQKPGTRVYAEVSVRVPGDSRFGLTPQRSSNDLLLEFVRPVPAVEPQPPVPRVPRITSVDPPAPSLAAPISIAGYAVGNSSSSRVYFTRDGVHLEAAVYGGGGLANDPSSGQSVNVTLPAAVTPGTWDLVVEVNGMSSAPFPLTVGERAAARIDRLQPSRVNPGSFVEVWGDHLHAAPLVLVDSRGREWTSEPSGVTWAALLEIPDEIAEGVATVRVNNPPGESSPDSRLASPADQVFTLIVTRSALPAEIDATAMRSVAPRQRTHVAIRPEDVLRQSERTQVEFQQGRKVFIVDTLAPGYGDILLPDELRAGPVTLRGRTWHAGAASEWSAPQTYEIAARLAGAEMSSLSVGAGQQDVHLSLGPARPAQFRASPGDTVDLSGDLPIENAAPVRVRAVSKDGRAVRLESARTGGIVRVTLPRTLGPGPWHLELSARDMATTRVPIEMLVVPW